jgi:PPE-repeat protein
MDFATLPPEINSGRMYSGPGAGSMMEAATAWGRLAARLCAAAADYRAVTAKLAAGCAGPASAAMTEAAARHIDWLDAVAARSEHAATQLTAAAGAHQSALTAMVPPPVITTNRTQRRSLARENCLGQTSPAIADLDAEYEQMWVRDGDAMYAYADASADAAALTPFTSPPGDQGGTAGTWTLKSAPDVVSAGSRVMSTIPAALQALSRSPLTSFNSSLSSVTPPLSRLSSLSAPSDSAIKHLNALNKDAALRSLFTKPARAGGATCTPGFGRGTSVGELSVPPAWATARALIAVYRGTVA